MHESESQVAMKKIERVSSVGVAASSEQGSDARS